VEPLILFEWSDETPQSVLALFAAETGIPVRLVAYPSDEEALQRLRAGERFDVAVVANYDVRPLAEAGVLMPLDLHRIPNFKNVTPSFRDLTIDPGNRYSIPYNWGTTGLIANARFVVKPVATWADLWDPVYCGRILLWYWQGRSLISATLKSLGYSANSDVPAELDAAQARLRALRPCVEVVHSPEAFLQHFPDVISGKLMIGIGSAHEAYLIRQRGFPAQYFFPTDGAILWGYSLVIPATSTQPAEAAQLLNFLLEPEIAAKLAGVNYYRVANDAALPLIDAELLNDPMLYPSTARLRSAEILLPLSPAGEQRYAEIWQEFLGLPLGQGGRCRGC
jgi:spermidine/putrescine transport system substrate-binding protein